MKTVGHWKSKLEPRGPGFDLPSQSSKHCTGGVECFVLMSGSNCANSYGS